MGVRLGSHTKGRQIMFESMVLRKEGGSGRRLEKTT
jgi:hypothetical protein